MCRFLFCFLEKSGKERAGVAVTYSHTFSLFAFEFLLLNSATLRGRPEISYAENGREVKCFTLRGATIASREVQSFSDDL